MNKIKRFFGKILCYFGYHDWRLPKFNFDSTYWEETCKREGCKTKLVCWKE